MMLDEPAAGLSGAEGVKLTELLLSLDPAAETTAEELLADPAAQRRYLGVEPLADAA